MQVHHVLSLMVHKVTAFAVPRNRWYFIPPNLVCINCIFYEVCYFFYSYVMFAVCLRASVCLRLIEMVRYTSSFNCWNCHPMINCTHDVVRDYCRYSRCWSSSWLSMCKFYWVLWWFRRKVSSLLNSVPVYRSTGAAFVCKVRGCYVCSFSTCSVCIRVDNDNPLNNLKVSIIMLDS